MMDDYRLCAHIDGTTHPVHDDISGLSAKLVDGDIATAEIQLAKVGGSVVVIVAGTVEQDTDERGNLRLRVWPNG